MKRTLSRLSLLLALAAMVLSVPVAHAQTNAVKLLKGTITDVRNGKPVGPGRVFVFQGATPEPVAQSRINPSTGAFQVVLAPSGTYRFVVRSPKYMTAEFPVTTPAGSEFEEISQSFQLEPIPVGRKLLSARAFDAGSSTVRTSPELTKLLELLKEHPAMAVAVVVAADGASAPAARPARATAPKRKGRKAAVQPAPEPAATPATEDPTGTQPALVDRRKAALRALFVDQEIAPSRIRWQLVTTPAEVKALGGDNLVVTIDAVKVSEAEDE